MAQNTFRISDIGRGTLPTPRTKLSQEKLYQDKFISSQPFAAPSNSGRNLKSGVVVNCK